MTTHERFKKMLDWLYTNRSVKNQTEVALAAGINETTVSRILKNRVKSVKLETLRAVNAAYGNVFNPEWIRGESDIMLAADVPHHQASIGTSMHADTTSASADLSGGMNTPDIGNLIRTTLMAKDETIMAMKRELAAKDDIISVLHSQLSDKDNLIADKERYILDLQQQLFALSNHSPQESPKKDFSHGYSYPLGVAERERGVSEP